MISRKKKLKSIKRYSQRTVNTFPSFRISFENLFSRFDAEKISQMTAIAIMDLYPEILDPEYDPKRKKQQVNID